MSVCLNVCERVFHIFSSVHKRSDEHLICKKKLEKRQVMQELHTVNSKINFVEKKSLLAHKLKLNM